MKKSSLGHEYAILGATLREAREKNHVTQVELAERLKQTQSYVSKCERGIVRVDFVQMRRICLTLGVAFPTFAQAFERNLRSSK
jgi:transcriptional regulator with XRE-family HTH domain